MWKNLSLISRISLEQKQTAISRARRGQTLSKWEKGKVKKLPSKLSELLYWLGNYCSRGDLNARAAQNAFSLSFLLQSSTQSVHCGNTLCIVCHTRHISIWWPRKVAKRIRDAARGTNEVALRCLPLYIQREKENTTHVTQLLFVLSISTREVYYAMHSPVSPWLRKSLEHQNL